MSWQHEHGADYAVPEDEITAAGLVDLSWHNDACPSFGVELIDPVNQDSHDLRLWAEHPDPDRRQSSYEARYVVNYQPWSTEPVAGLTVCDDGDIYSGDDLQAALQAYCRAAQYIADELARRAAYQRRLDRKGGFGS